MQALCLSSAGLAVPTGSEAVRGCAFPRAAQGPCDWPGMAPWGGKEGVQGGTDAWRSPRQHWDTWPLTVTVPFRFPPGALCPLEHRPVPVVPILLLHT